MHVCSWTWEARVGNVYTKPFINCFNPHLNTCFLIDSRERERNVVPPEHAPTKDRTHNPSMCPDWPLTHTLLVFVMLLQLTEPLTWASIDKLYLWEMWIDEGRGVYLFYFHNSELDFYRKDICNFVKLPFRTFDPGCFWKVRICPTSPWITAPNKW